MKATRIKSLLPPTMRRKELLLFCILYYTSTILILVPLSVFLLPAVDALIVAPPASSTDYRQLATLLVSTFDAPPQPSSSSSTNQNYVSATKIEAMQWMLYEKSLTEQYTYNQYMSTTRKMRGKKYALFVAKEYIPPSQDNDHRASYRVVGMVEMGVTVGPVSISEKELVGIMSLRPRATVGVLCVSSSHQNQGIGQALVEKCEYIAKNLWNETRLVVEVEPCNGNALRFFDKYGYEGMKRGADGGFEMRNATVSRRRKVESRPHFVLEKEF